MKGPRKQPHGPGVQGYVHFVFLLTMVPIKGAIAISIAIGFVFLVVFFGGGGACPQKNNQLPISILEHRFGAVNS